FQAEDGIRDDLVTGVQTCALPISLPEVVTRGFSIADDGSDLIQAARQIVAKTLETSSTEEMGDWGVMKEKIRADLKRFIAKKTRSEERRVGKEERRGRGR